MRPAFPGKLVAILHTRNRPDFVERALRYYAKRFHYPIVVLDGSNEAHFKTLQSVVASCAAIPGAPPIDLVHRSEDTPFLQRLDEALQEIAAPYILLMADDDFYFESWADTGIRYLDKHANCSVVYGHTLMFETHAGYQAYGQADRFCFSVPNPVARWLEGETAQARLTELGRGPYSTNGWYAMQRRDAFASIVRKAREARFGSLLAPEAPYGELDMLERMVNLLQPIYGKVVMLDTTFLARQADPAMNRKSNAWRWCAGAMSRLAEIGTDVMVEVTGTKRSEARAVIENALAPEVFALKQHDRRDALRIDWFRKHAAWVAPAVRQWRKFRGAPYGAQPVPDARFAKVPPLRDVEREIREVKAACVRGVDVLEVKDITADP
jgi:glycosyltransferase domain-containing protein